MISDDIQTEVSPYYQMTSMTCLTYPKLLTIRCWSPQSDFGDIVTEYDAFEATGDCRIHAYL